MIIIDTSVWIEFLNQSNPEIEMTVLEALENNKAIALSFVFGELLQGARDLHEERSYWSFGEFT